MGFFFEEPKKEELPPPVQKPGFFHEAGMAIVLAIIGLVAWIGKGLISFALEHTPTKVKIALLIAIPVLVYSLIPHVRDMVSLSKNQTINLVEKIAPFPEKELFYLRDGRKLQGDIFTYVTYQDSYNILTSVNTCYLVPRGNELHLRTFHTPVYAVGFTDEVTFTSAKKTGDLSSWNYAKKAALNPIYFTKARDSFDEEMTYQTLSLSWNEFKEGMVATTSAEITISAKWNEHAMICF